MKGISGHIRKRGSRSWEIIYEAPRGPDGKRRQKRETVHGTKKDAADRLAEIRTGIGKGTYVDPHRLMVREYLPKWLEHQRGQVTAKTFERYDEICRRHLIPALGDELLLKLQPMQVQLYYDEAVRSGRLDGNGGLNPRTVLQHHRVLNEALSCAVAWGLLAINPLHKGVGGKRVRPPRFQVHQVRVLTSKEAAALLRAADGTRLHVPVLLALATGMRRGEILGLRWKDVDLERAILTVAQAAELTRKGGVKFKAPKTARGRRTVALPTFAVEALKAHQVQHKKERLAAGPAYQQNGLIFCSPLGTVWRPDNFSKGFSALVRDAGLQAVTFHELRHTHASELFHQGVHVKVVSERLGHASVAFTLDTYGHLMPGMQEDAASRIDQAMREALEEGV